jgi:Na+-transporting methylmalonyl-CoA/oxaloacetate decarboxylase gamma subunit
MNDPIVIALVVSGIGMLTLFLALAFLYGLMYLMTALIQDRPQEQEAGSRKWRAAAIAVALACAEQDLSPAGALETESATSAWRALHHQRQLALNMPVDVRTRRAR